VKLNAIHRQQRGERGTDIARARQVPKTPIHTILTSAQEIEIAAPNLLKHTTVKAIRHRSDVVEVTEMRLVTWIEALHEEEGAKIKPLVHQEAGFSAFSSGMASKI
jgi:hypothetical protein